MAAVWSLLVTLVCLGVALQPAHCALTCPEMCTCRLEQSPYMVACNSKNLTAVPSEIPVGIEEFYFTNNHLSSLARGALTKFVNLTNLLLNRCEIKSIEPNAFSELGRLHTLDLRWNQLSQLQSYLFSGLLRLKNLYLDHNAIETIENFAFHGLNLSRLGLERNDGLREIAGKAFKGAKVETLLLLNSSLDGPSTVAALAPLRNSLRQLYWQSNQRPLTLPQDSFTGFLFTGLKLNNNGLRDIEFLENVFTDELWLQHNPTGPIDFSRFPNLRQVRKLNLDNTSFSFMPASALRGMTHLTFLSLAQNGITSLGEDLRPFFMRLTHLSMDGNKLHCNCEVRWLKHWEATSSGVSAEALQCATPSAQDLQTMQDDHLTCSRPSIVTISRALNVSEHQEVTLTCVGEGDPAPTITWYSPDGESMSVPPPHNRTHTENQGIFHIHSTSSDNIGMYRCTAVNLAGNDTYQAHVNVYKSLKPVVGGDEDPGASVAPTSHLSLLLLLVSCMSMACTL